MTYLVDRQALLQVANARAERARRNAAETAARVAQRRAELAGWGQQHRAILAPRPFTPRDQPLAHPVELMALHRIGVTPRVPAPQPQLPQPNVLGELLKVGLVAAGIYAGVQILRAASRTMRESHDYLAEKLAKRLARDPRWLVVTADVRGWPKPPVIDGARGDVYAEHEDGTRLLIEVEHEHTLETPHFRDHQAPCFERWERRSPHNVFAVELTTRARRSR
jgi:hypothetical protein